MKKGGSNSEHSENKSRKFGCHESMKNKEMKRNMQRLGGNGGGLSLESFANAKTRSGSYNPSLIKKHREFYKNAKYLRRYKKSLKLLERENAPSDTIRPFEGGNGAKEGGEAEAGDHVNRQRKNTRSALSLQQVYEKKCEEDEKARTLREAVIQARKQEIQQVEARRRALKEKMYKKTKSGQPLMKYRIEHLLETIQGSTS